jgi:hypothetical protein
MIQQAENRKLHGLTIEHAKYHIKMVNEAQYYYVFKEGKQEAALIGLNTLNDLMKKAESFDKSKGD